DIFVRELGTGTTTQVSVSSAGVEGNGNSLDPSISADGRFVAFDSNATNLVGGGLAGVFIRDRRNHTTTRVSVSSAAVEGNDGSYDPWISPSGRFVAFDSVASDLVGGDTNGTYDVFVRDRETGTTTRVSVNS